MNNSPVHDERERWGSFEKVCRGFDGPGRPPVMTLDRLGHKEMELWEVVGTRGNLI